MPKKSSDQVVWFCHCHPRRRKRHATEVAPSQSAARDRRQAVAGSCCRRRHAGGAGTEHLRHHRARSRRGACRSQATGIGFVLQSEQRGTGHAMMQAREALRNFQHVLVLSGDVPLIAPQTIARVRDFHTANDAAMTILTAEPDGSHRLWTRLPQNCPKARRPTKSNASSSRRRCAAAKPSSARLTPASMPSATAPLYAHIQQARHRQCPS